MCGITGWVSFDRDLTRERETLDAMTGTMACRGPDSSGTWVGRNAALGHRRLAVIDLPGGRQPMSVQTPDGEVALVYSGETYNFTELREELVRQGERFTTSSDTEVVLRGYLRWGETLVDRLNGMYAFALWDARSRKLVMIRDRMGIKPLYYHPVPGGLLFGSEPKAILANPLAQRVVNVDGIRESLSYAFTPGHCLWAGMRQVEPGTLVTLDSGGLRERTYWRLETRPHTDDVATTVATVRELLDDTVRRQLVADVPRCVLLSGGLDSGTLTALSAAHLGEERVRTFSVDFTGQAENFRPDELRDAVDAPFVKAMAEHVGSDHADIVIGAKALADPDIRRATITARDLPISMGDIDFSLYLLFKEIRKRSTVALSGEAADEIFGGYKHMHIPEIQQARTFPWIVFNIGAFDKDGTGIRPGLWSDLKLEEYRREQYESALGEIRRLQDTDGPEDDFEYRMRVMIYLHLTRFMRFLLDRKDRLSMAVGLEVRVPFCDHRIVEYVYNAPWLFKTYDGREKSLLRGAVRDVLPNSVALRPKSAYPSTQDPYYFTELQEQAKELLARRNHEVFLLIDRGWLETATGREAAGMDRLTRLGLERTLDFATWLDVYSPDLRLS
ncbi:asparagine synthase (glutamine-hydrolyzing) [Streptomyces calidiresistens]|uniref:asparagine synthase (glutamine-hydrolyzing) n=1 Tax=Streptomyces calidiresistens TaxID=1485586 RepID=A0A7W3SZ84_9ACTN|nr:asparagine synthase (glutamine-hydrolyzing) [Streptomyces calidiresistens]MBB0227983.1 asparagine synthase (glutamine-hydrolyzing) [Streptomyces calidiresistens]